MISTGSVDTPLPCNVNDSEFDELSSVIKSHETSLTEMSFALLTYEATSYIQRFHTPENSSKGDTWQQRLDLAQTFGRHVQDRYLQYCDMSIAFHRLISAVGRSMSASMILRAIRPMQRHISSVPPRVDTPYVLQIAVDSLRETDNMHEILEVERWRFVGWVQWHALAVGLAGLCSIRGTELAETAWIYVNRSYARHSEHIADTRSGMLWRPIKKLYKKANEFRDAGHRDSQPHCTPQCTPQLSMDVPHTTFSTYLPPAQYPQMPARVVSNDPTMTSPMEFGVNDAAGGISPLRQCDMSWLEWQTVMDDLSVMNTSDVNINNIQQLQTVQAHQNWSRVLQNDLV